VPARASLQRLRPQRPFYAPSHAASPSTYVAASAVAHQGRCRAALLAAAQTIRVKSAMAQPRTIHASALSLSRTGRVAVDRAGPSPSACWSDAPRPPATQCVARRGTAPSSVPWAASLRPRLDGRRFQPGLADTCGSFATIGPGPRWRVSPSAPGQIDDVTPVRGLSDEVPHRDVRHAHVTVWRMPITGDSSGCASGSVIQSLRIGIG
jgi:hypothetical protein